MGALSSKYGWVTAAEESSYDGGAASSSTDSLLLAGEPEFREVYENVTADDIIKPTQGGFDHLRYKSHVEYSFEVRVGGMDASNDGAPSIGPLLIGGGFAEATSGSDGTNDLTYTYTPLTTGHGSNELVFAMRDRDNGNAGLLTLTGCRHTFTFTGSVNNDLRIQVTGRGLFAKRQPFASATLPTTLGLDVGRFALSNITLEGDSPSASTTYHCTEWEYSPNWEVAQDNSLSTAESGQEIILNRSQKHGGSINPRQLASHYDANDFVDDLRDANRIALSTVVSGASESLTFTMNALQCESREDSADGQTWRHNVGYTLSEPTVLGDDDITIEWTQV